MNNIWNQLFQKWHALYALLFLFCVLPEIYAQTDTQPYQDELNRVIKVPDSPEAAAFQEYGNTSVSLYTGTPNISIPIYNYQGLEFDIPINLTYDATGVKVEQLANQAGLSWNLALGGRITRVVNGLPDDYISSAPSQYSSFYCNDVKDDIIDYEDQNEVFDTEQEIHDYVDFKQNISKNIIDTEPDYYSLNALGMIT